MTVREIIRPDARTFERLTTLLTDAFWKTPLFSEFLFPGRKPLARTFLAALLQYAPTTAVAPSESVAAPLRALAEARERLADDDLPPPSLGALAARAGVSRYRFLRAFAAAYGLPPHAWAAQHRLARAERLLAQGHAPAEAALAAGFADQSHLTRALRRFRGYTPGQLAAMARG